MATYLTTGRVTQCSECSHGKYNIVGKRFGRLVVLEICGSFKSGRKQKTSRYLRCLCDCGNITIVTKNNLYHGCTRSCGCLAKEVNRLPHGVAASNRIFSSYKRSAKRKNLKFLLSFHEFIRITSKNCVYCGSTPTNTQKNKSGTGDFIYSGIDRVVPEKGYTLENCVPCCRSCNTAKHTMLKHEFANWVVKVYNYFAKNFAEDKQE